MDQQQSPYVYPAPLLASLTRLGMAYKGTWWLMAIGLLVLAGVNGLIVVLSEKMFEAFGPIMLDGDLRQQLPVEEIHALAEDERTFDSFFAFVIPAALAAGGSWYLSQLVSQRAMFSLREKFLRHFIDIELAFHTKAARGDVISRMSADMEASTGAIGALYGRLQVRPFEAMGIIVLMFTVDYRLALILIALLIPVRH